MVAINSRQEILADCHLLFGPDVVVSDYFITSLEASDIKLAYRRRALQTHPDRTKLNGENEVVMNRLFKDVGNAYERLNSLVDSKRGFTINDRKPSQGSCNKVNKRRNEYRQRDTTDHFYKCDFIPKRKLLIAQFLYYTGLVSWKTVFESVCWQKNQRPFIGQVALEMGFLSAKDIRDILLKPRGKKRFAEYAWHNGYITGPQYSLLIDKQRTLQPLIGEYFINKGLLSAEELDNMIKKLRFHNKDVFSMV